MTAQDAYEYVLQCGEPHPDAPVTEGTKWAIAHFDGNNNDDLWYAIEASFAAEDREDGGGDDWAQFDRRNSRSSGPQY